MTAVKVKDNNGVVGYVATEHWADPDIFMMDFQVAENGVSTDGDKVFAGDTFPKYREDLEYCGIEEF